MFIRKAMCLLLTTALLTGFGALVPMPQAAQETVPSVSGLSGEPGQPVEGTEKEVAFSFGSAQEMLAAMTPAAENDRFRLLYDPDTLAVALQDVENGGVLLSNPYNASEDLYATGNIEKNLESQVVLTYVDTYNVKADLWSSADCAELGQYRILPYENGLRVELSIGREQTERIVPEAMTVERFETLTAQMPDRAKRRMELFYKRYALADITDESERERLLGLYPVLETQDLYISIELSEREKDDVESYLTDAGYTLEQYEADLQALGGEVEETYVPNFRLAVEYVLTEEGLTVTIPNDSVQYDREHFALLSIRLLEFFAADGPSEDGDGYLFIPDGSGALIDINGQDENRRRILSGQVYGLDAAIQQTVSDREGEAYRMPVFGIVRNDHTASFAIIESGDDAVEITAKLGEPNSSYYTVYPTFCWTSEEFVTVDTKVSSLNSAKKIYIYDDNVTTNDLTVRYYALAGDQADYSSMAAIYRAYLTARGMDAREEANHLHFGLETLGTALYSKDFLGFSYQADAAFTTYERSAEIAAYFRDNGVDNLFLSLTGWREDGLDAGIADRLRLSGALGGKTGFRSLLDWTGEQGIPLFPDLDFLFVARDGWFDGFSPSGDAARMLDKEYAGIARFEPDTQQYGELQYAVSPSRYAGYLEGFLKNYREYDHPALSLSTMGEYLNSDFASAHPSNRGQSMQTITGLLAGLEDEFSLSFDGGNAYVLPYASLIRDVPTECSNYLGESASVPFYQLAVSGAVSCQSAPVNLNEDAETTLLRCIESRTSPGFVLAGDHIERLKKTDYSYYYAVSFEVLKEKVLEQYRYVAEALAPVEGSPMIAHRLVADGVACTAYDNGVSIYVNYNNEPYSAGEIVVPARGYLAVD